MNVVLQRKADLRHSNYILNPNPKYHYFVNVTCGRVRNYLTRCGEAFNVVIRGGADENDFYAIPYAVLKPSLADHYITPGRQVRWMVSITNHQFRVHSCPYLINVGAYYGNHAILTNPGQVNPTSAADENDYAIENRKIEVEQRLKQSVFRQRIIQNFEGKCCLSGISEEELLVASHIVPWAKRIDTRLDPANGLLLYWSYDRLFDKGFISFDDSLRVVVSLLAASCSTPLCAILEPLNGQQARAPVRWTIKPEYLAYHRAEVLQGGPLARLGARTGSSGLE